MEETMRKVLWSMALAALLATTGCGNGSANVGEPDEGIEFDSLPQEDQEPEDDLVPDNCSDLDKDGYFSGT